MEPYVRVKLMAAGQVGLNTARTSRTAASGGTGVSCKPANAARGPHPAWRADEGNMLLLQPCTEHDEDERLRQHEEEERERAKRRAERAEAAAAGGGSGGPGGGSSADDDDDDDDDNDGGGGGNGEGGRQQQGGGGGRGRPGERQTEHVGITIELWSNNWWFEDDLIGFANVYADFDAMLDAPPKRRVIKLQPAVAASQTQNDVETAAAAAPGAALDPKTGRPRLKKAGEIEVCLSYSEREAAPTVPAPPPFGDGIDDGAPTGAKAEILAAVPTAFQCVCSATTRDLLAPLSRSSTHSRLTY